MRATALSFAAALVMTACTGGGTPTAAPAPSITTAPSPPVTTPPVTTTPPPGPIDAADLPATCDAGAPGPTQTLAFVAGGSAWAMDPATGDLTCLFTVEDPGPFAWGPLGDRVVVGNGEVVGPDGGPIVRAEDMGSTFGWSKPTGKSLVYVRGDDEVLSKQRLTGGDPEPLLELPAGTYEAVAYHPSGLAMAVSVHDGDEPQIFIATNEGAREKRVVVGLSAVSFPSLAFDETGQNLYYVAEHKGGYVQVHRVDLGAAALVDGWRSDAPLGQATGLFVAPDGSRVAVTVSEGDCDTSTAMTGFLDDLEPALPDADGPTHALGYLDDRRVLVGVGGCGGSMDLWVGAGTRAEPIVTGVDQAASRRVGPQEAAEPLPEDLLGEIQEFG